VADGLSLEEHHDRWQPHPSRFSKEPALRGVEGWEARTSEICCHQLSAISQKLELGVRPVCPQVSCPRFPVPCPQVSCPQVSPDFPIRARLRNQLGSFLLVARSFAQERSGLLRRSRAFRWEWLRYRRRRAPANAGRLHLNCFTGNSAANRANSRVTASSVMGSLVKL
jgi:hypothetical protein